MAGPIEAENRKEKYANPKRCTDLRCQKQSQQRKIMNLLNNDEKSLEWTLNGSYMIGEENKKSSKRNLLAGLLIAQIQYLSSSRMHG